MCGGYFRKAKHSLLRPGALWVSKFTVTLKFLQRGHRTLLIGKPYVRSRAQLCPEDLPVKIVTIHSLEPLGSLYLDTVDP